ncbi:ABC-type transport auxiliary lipoprotein family protein [uncultured Algimonas sp.]|uniref:ABC-type transport auxiliary lipoprotein family protein n=1 Tax=uncultured Algimonas sp. TaxID=1547920 RepID=UPI0026382B00|nr:ABC-type transport auxiliary lipoprotein family protein [uncultured Algimonas sp.]
MIRPFALGVASLAIASCSILPDPAPADIIYRLQLSGESVKPAPGATVIRVDRPSATSVFNTRAIVVSPDGRRLSTAAQAQWPEGTPTMLQEKLVDAFSRESRVIGVLPQSGTRTDTRIHLTIKNFEAQFDQGEDASPLAVVRFTATLANATDRRLIDTFTTRHEVRADAARISSIVMAIEAANDAAMRDIVDWVVSADKKGLIEDPVTLVR